MIQKTIIKSRSVGCCGSSVTAIGRKCSPSSSTIRSCGRGAAVGTSLDLLRETVRVLLAGHKVYITDWVDARMVPNESGPFTLEDYVNYLREFIQHLGAAACT